MIQKLTKTTLGEKYGVSLNLFPQKYQLIHMKTRTDQAWNRNMTGQSAEAEAYTDCISVEVQEPPPHYETKKIDDEAPVIIFTNPSARAGYDTRSIFQRSLTGFNSEFSFS